MSYNPANYPIADSDVLRGSLVMTFNNPNDDASAYYTVTVNSALRNQEYVDSNNLFTTYLYVGDIVTVTMYGGLVSQYLNVTRIDYTTDANEGNNGIYTVDVTSVSGSGTVSFTATTVNTSYNFEYHVDMGTLVPPTPTPTPSITPTLSLSPTETPTPTVTPTMSATLTATPTATPTVTPSLSSTPGASPTPTPTVTPSTPPDVSNFVIMGVGGNFASGPSNEALDVGYTYKSNDNGSTWQVYTGTPVYHWLDFSMSDNAKYILASTLSGDTSYALLSSDYGMSYDIKRSGDRLVEGVAVSSTGQYQYYAVRNEGIYRSTDYGVTFTQPNPLLVNNKTGIATSANGQYVLTYQSYSSPGVKTLFVSNDYGVTYTGFYELGPGVGNVSMSVDGQIMYFTFAYSIYKSTDYGVSWNVVSTIPSDRTIQSMYSSNNGQFITVTLTGFYYGGGVGPVRPGEVYVSNDYGVTFNLKTMPIINWFNSKVTVNDNGQYQIVNAWSSGLQSTPNSPNSSGCTFLSMDYGYSWSNVNPSGITAFEGVEFKHSGIYPTPTPTSTVTPTMSMTPTSTVTPTMTPTATITQTPTMTMSPTMSMTPTLTPTPSVTPVPITLKYKYTGSSAGGATKRTSGRNIRWGSTTYSMSFSTDWTTSTGTAEVTLGTSFLLSSGLTAYRNICRVSGSATQVDSYTINIYQNGTLVDTYTNNTNTTITLCPTTVNTNRSFTETFNAGDIVLVEWIDNVTF